MGNTATSTKRDRNYSYSIDGLKSDDHKNSLEYGKKKQFLYQQSIDTTDDGEDYKHQRVRTSTISEGASIDKNALPTVFKWEKEHGGKNVYIKGTFSDWKPIKMSHSHGDFVTIINIPEGEHEYKYVVDGSDQVNSNAKIDDNSKNNVISVKRSDFEVFEALACDLASNTKSNDYNSMNNGSPKGSYSQEMPNIYELSRSNSGGGSGPPILPPHLQQVILNNPSVTNEPTILPQPNHVMLNHLYALSIKDGVMVLSCTHRYRKKYVTTLLYKPIN